MRAVRAQQIHLLADLFLFILHVVVRARSSSCPSVETLDNEKKTPFMCAILPRPQAKKKPEDKIECSYVDNVEDLYGGGLARVLVCSLFQTR